MRLETSPSYFRKKSVWSLLPRALLSSPGEHHGAETSKEATLSLIKKGIIIKKRGEELVVEVIGVFYPPLG